MGSIMDSIMLPPVQDTQEILAMDLGWRWSFRQKGALSQWQTWDWVEQLGVLRRWQTILALSHWFGLRAYTRQGRVCLHAQKTTNSILEWNQLHLTCRFSFKRSVWNWKLPVFGDWSDEWSDLLLDVADKCVEVWCPTCSLRSFALPAQHAIETSSNTSSHSYPSFYLVRSRAPAIFSTRNTHATHIQHHTTHVQHVQLTSWQQWLQKICQQRA